MNSVVIKKYVFCLVLLAVAGFSFARDIRVVGVIPGSDTGRLYQLQIGAFRLAANVDKAYAVLTKNGFVPRCERKGDLTRVFVVVPAVKVRSAVDSLERAGFREVVIREYCPEAVEPARTPPPIVEPPMPDVPAEPVVVEPKIEAPVVEEPPVEIVPDAEEVTIEEPPVIPAEEAVEEIPDDVVEDPAGKVELPVEEAYNFEVKEPDHNLIHLQEEVY